MASKNITYTAIKAGERLDNIAKRVYGNVNKVKLLIENNPTLDIWNPEPGQKVKIVNV